MATAALNEVFLLGPFVFVMRRLLRRRLAIAAGNVFAYQATGLGIAINRPGGGGVHGCASCVSGPS